MECKCNDYIFKIAAKSIINMDAIAPTTNREKAEVNRECPKCHQKIRLTAEYMGKENFFEVRTGFVDDVLEEDTNKTS